MNEPVLIIGGYGVVGFQVAQIISKYHPDLPLLIAGRNLQSASAKARELPNAKPFVIDIEKEISFEKLGIKPSVVMAVANDPENHLLRAAIKEKIPYIDITRWTERLLDAIELTTTMELNSSVSFASSWMAGVSSIIAKAAAFGFSSIENIETSILYRLADKAGPNSVEYADRFGIPFRIRKDGKWKMVNPASDAKSVTFPSGETYDVIRFDEPSQETLALHFNSPNASSRIGYDDKATMGFMLAMVRSGIWKLISGDIFTNFRRSMLYNPGNGASQEFVIDIIGKDENQNPKTTKATVLDPEGQTHLTAVGAYIQLQEALGLAGRPSRTSGIYLPEAHTNPAHAIAVLKDNGIKIEIK